jgi:hypothetical protein
MAEAREALVPFLRQASSALERIAQELAVWETRIGMGGIDALIRWCKGHYAIDQCTLRAWFRVVKGELPRELLTDTLIQHSTLAHMDAEVAAKLADRNKKFLIASPTEGRLVNKSVFDMTPEECGRQVRPQVGVVPYDQDTAAAPFRRLRGTNIRASFEKNCVDIDLPGARITVFVGRRDLQNAMGA